MRLHSTTTSSCSKLMSGVYTTNDIDPSFGGTTNLSDISMINAP